MTAPELDRELVRQAAESPKHLLDLLTDGLNWPVPEDKNLIDHLIPLKPEELHLNPELLARFDSLQQIPPLVTGQTFAVFLLGFSGGRLPVGAIKRIVNRLVRKKRTGATTGRRAVWDLEDLLFFCQSSEGVNVVHVVAFQERDNKPVLRVAKWSADATDNRIDLVATNALPALIWPGEQGDLRAWKQQWTTGFTGVREGINTARKLARKMAQVAREVRDGVRELYVVEKDTGPLRTLAAEIKANLLDDLTPEDFADMFAETMVYGLLTARITHPEDFAADALASAFRFDNPFLDAVYQRFKEQAGDTFDIDELGLAGLADALAAADIAEVLADFGTEGRKDDPVVHFYEDFLADYNPEKRIELGVYYTPQPVVRYIIRSIDETLKRDFGLALGIADPTTWGELAERIEGFEVPEGVDPDRPYVSMLDPATGTGTFLVEWLALAEENVRSNARAGGVPLKELDAVWLAALTKTVLPNMAAFEITMASYAVAHLKVSLSLPVGLRGRQRLPIFLTNTLRPTKAAEGTMDFDNEPISEERRIADAIKDDRPVTVIVGNPPYLERARGLGGIVEEVDDGMKKSPSLDLFREKGTGKLDYKIHNLNVYFWRWATWKALIDSGETGIVSFITTSPYLTSPAFQGMRRWIRENTNNSYVVDCTPEGHQPNVPTRLFPGVQQPLAIMTLASSPGPRVMGSGTVHYRSIEGTQADKFSALDASGIEAPEWSVAPDGPTDGFLGAGSDLWLSMLPLEDLHVDRTPGVKPNRIWVIAPHGEVLANRWQAFQSTDPDDRPALLKETRDRKIGSSVQPLPGQPARPPLSVRVGDCLPVVPLALRSFDSQYLIPDSRVLDRARPALWRLHGDQQTYIIELHTEGLRAGPGLVFSDQLPEDSYFKGRGGRVFPLWRDADATVANLTPGFLDAWGGRLRVSVAPIEWLEYLAGVTGYPGFQEHFADDLVTPGMRIPLTTDVGLYERARSFGRVALAANTRRQRGDIRDREVLVSASDRLEAPLLVEPISSDPDNMPESFRYVPEEQALLIGTGRIAPVNQGVIDFTTSGMNVFRKWFNYRKKNPSGRTREGLNGINATHWYPEWTEDLVALLGDLTLLVELTPAHREFLVDLVDGPLLTWDELRAALG